MVPRILVCLNYQDLQLSPPAAICQLVFGRRSAHLRYDSFHWNLLSRLFDSRSAFFENLFRLVKEYE
jgi:hypothetical protein